MSNGFRTAKVFGGPTLSDIKNNIVVVAHTEEFTRKRHKKIASGETPHRLKENESKCFIFETAYSTVRPTFREVILHPQDYGESGAAVLMELQSQEPGVMVFRQHSLENNNQQSIHAYYFPEAKMLDLTSGPDSKKNSPKVTPKPPWYELRIYCEASDTGEILYQTNTTRINDELIAEDDKVFIEKKMATEIAEVLAHYSNQPSIRTGRIAEQKVEGVEREPEQVIHDMLMCFLYGTQICRLVPGPDGDPAGYDRHLALANWMLE